MGSATDLQVDTGPDESIPPLIVDSSMVSSPEVDETESPDDQAAKQYIQSLIDHQVTASIQQVKTQLEGNLQAILREAKSHNDLLQEQLRQSVIRNNTLNQEVECLR